jgi:hypothetical protein
MRLVRIGRAVWDVLAIADESGRSLWDELLSADPSHGAAEQMRAMLKEHVPRSGPPRGINRSRHLGDEIYEFKRPGVRVLWFYDAGEPIVRWRIVCTHVCPKLPEKKFQQERAKAVRMRTEYLAAKSAGKLREPEG